jgi:diguanylate cyclase
MLKARSKAAGHRITAGEDKAYDTADHVTTLRAMKVTPHVTQNNGITKTGRARKSAIDERTTRHQGYATYVRAQSETSTPSNAPEQLNRVVDSARRFLTASIADSRTQITALGKVSDDFKTTGDPKQIIEALVYELGKAISRASTLEADFVQTSQQLENLRVSLSEAEHRSKIDALTGLANRRSFDEFLRTAQMNAMETGEPFCIFMIDVDYFKFNDLHGHQIGDRVLRLVSKVLQDSVREIDLVARYGGEELIVVVPGAGLAATKEVAERVRRRIADARLTKRTTGQEIGSVTVSIGVAQFRLAESSDALVERCDRGLYHAKNTGRNRTIAENEVPSLSPVAQVER